MPDHLQRRAPNYLQAASQYTPVQLHGGSLCATAELELVINTVFTTSQHGLSIPTSHVTLLLTVVHPFSFKEANANVDSRFTQK